MSRGRKAIVALAAVVVIAVLAWWFWPRNVYMYQGKTVEGWFSEFIAVGRGTRANMRPLNAFAEMGTNTVPFLASRINRDLAPSLLEQWRNKLPTRFRSTGRSTPKAFEAFSAAWLCNQVKPPEEMLRLLLKPALQSTNQLQREAAARALP